jgi:hypothetical protein
MAGLLTSLRKIVSDTTQEIIDSEISTKMASVMNTLVDAAFGAVDAVLAEIRDVTEEPEETEEEP